jgi:membrane associated rhomboid family serine protease
VFPLRDNLPTLRFPVITVAIIAINVAVFIWQQTLSSDPGTASIPQLQGTELSRSEQATYELGSIPFRITHPGENCAFVAQPSLSQRVGVLCEGSRAYEHAAQVAAGGNAELVPIDEIPWYLTLLTSLFLHGGILHIAFNMLFLWVFGNNIEDSMGRPKFVLFYLLAGIVAAYAQAFLSSHDAIPQIGASGAIAGVLGGYALLNPRARVLTLIFIVFFITFVEIPALPLLAIWFVLQFIPALGQATSSVAGTEGVAYMAHVGGFVFGLATIRLFVKRRLGPAPS